MNEKEINFINKIAWRVYNTYLGGTDFQNMVSVDDLIHYGVIGYFDAQRTYDVDRGGKWLDYLSTRAGGTMIAECLRKLPMIRIPQDKRRQVKELMTAKEQLSQNGIASRDELASQLGWSIDKVYEIEILQPHVDSLEVDNSGESGDSYKNTTLDIPMKETPLDLTLQKEIAEIMQNCMETLPPVNRLIINGRFSEEMTLKELAVLLDCAVQRVHQRQKQALSQLKNCFEINGWEWDEDLWA